MLISLIVPVYNSEKYLKKCIDSILNQTYSNFELILVDDGSVDKSPQICDDYARKDSRIVVIHQKNQGQAVARNKALDVCKGDYISFVDSDDYVHPQMLEVLMNTMQKSNAEIVVCDYVQGYDTNFNWNDNDIVDDFTLFDGKTFLSNCLIGKTGKNWLLWDKIYKKTVFNDIRLPEGRIYEDNATVYKLIYGANKVAYSNNVLYYYFTNSESTVNKNFSPKHLDWLLVVEEMIEFFNFKNEVNLLEWANRCYLNSLTDLYSKVSKYCPSEICLRKELKSKLKKLYGQERRKYRINIKTYPNVIEILYPTYAKIYWGINSVKNKMKGR